MWYKVPPLTGTRSSDYRGVAKPSAMIGSVISSSQLVLYGGSGALIRETTDTSSELSKKVSKCKRAYSFRNLIIRVVKQMY